MYRVHYCISEKLLLRRINTHMMMMMVKMLIPGNYCESSESIRDSWVRGTHINDIVAHLFPLFRI